MKNNTNSSSKTNENGGRTFNLEKETKEQKTKSLRLNTNSNLFIPQ